MTKQLSRRGWFGASAAVASAAARAARGESPMKKDPFTYCLNTSTIRGQNLSIVEEIDLASRAGFQAIEPWIGELDKHVQSGGKLKDLAKRIGDAGLAVASAIGFPQWIVDDETQRRKGLEEAKRNMDLVRQIGGKRLAAPPAGAQDRGEIPLAQITERYRALLELGDKLEVVPQLELWGFSKTLNRLGDVMHVAMDVDHPKACILLDVYHLYKGGSGFTGIRLLGPGTMFCFHMNDYPSKPKQSTITDAHRVYPGDGVAPLMQILHDLVGIGFQGALSLELFNRDYWKQDALHVVKTGLEKMKAAVRTARAS